MVNTFKGKTAIGVSQAVNSGTTSNDGDIEVIDAFSDVRPEVVGASNAFTITDVTPTWIWERFVTWRFTDDAPPPTAQITVDMPVGSGPNPKRGIIGIINATTQEIKVEITGQSLPSPTIFAGAAAVLCSDGVNVEVLSSGGGTLESLTDVDTLVGEPIGDHLTIKAGGGAEWTTPPSAGAGDALPFVLSPKWRGARIQPSAAQTSIGTGVVEVVFNSTKIDTDSIADLANNALKVPAGVTKIRLAAYIQVLNADTDGFLFIDFKINDASLAADGARSAVRFERPTAASDSEILAMTPAIDVVVNDSFTLNVQIGGDATADVSTETWYEMEIVETTDTVPSLRTVVVNTPHKFRGAKIRPNTDLTTQNFTTPAVVAMNEVVSDTDLIADLANDKLIVPAGVNKVRIIGHVEIENADVSTDLQVSIQKNGTPSWDGNPKHRGNKSDSGTADLFHGGVNTGTINVSAGDDFALEVFIATDTSVIVKEGGTFIEMELIEFNGGTAVPTAFIAIPPEHKGATIDLSVAQSIPDAASTTIVNWNSLMSGGNTFDSGDGGPPQRFWLGVNRTFVDGDVDTIDDEITDTAHGFQKGEGPVLLKSSGTLPAGLALATKYWIGVVDGNTITFHTSRANALAGTPKVNITAAAGGGTHSLETADNFVIPAGIAKVRLSGSLVFATGTTSLRYICFIVEGLSPTTIVQKRSQQTGDDSPNTNCDSGVKDVVEGEIYYLQAFQDSSAAVDVNASVGTLFEIEVVEEIRPVTFPNVTVRPPTRIVTASLSVAIADANLTSSTAVAWDQVDEQTEVFWLIGAPTRITIPNITDILRASFNIRVQFTNVTGDDGDIEVKLRKNGATDIDIIRHQGNKTDASPIVGLTVTDVPIAANDYFEVFVVTNGADVLIGIGKSSYFTMTVTETNDNILALDPSNVIINGNMDIWQRGTTFIPAVSNTTGPDGFQWFQVGVGVVDMLQSTSVPNGLSDFSLQIDVTTIDATIDAGDFYTLVYSVEGYDALRVGFGTSDATKLTLSFWARSPKTGIHCVAFRNSAINRSYVVEYTIAVADTLEDFHVTLTADTGGTWLTDNGVGVSITWALAVGANFQGVANTWNSANDFATSNQVNVMDNVANNFHIADVRLVVGGRPVKTTRRLFALEDIATRRYAWVIKPGASDNFGVGQAISTTIAHIFIPFPTQMRVAPSLAISAAGDFDLTTASGSLEPVTALTILQVSVDGVTLSATVAANIVAGDATQLLDDGGGNAEITLSAEL